MTSCPCMETDIIKQHIKSTCQPISIHAVEIDVISQTADYSMEPKPAICLSVSDCQEPLKRINGMLHGDIKRQTAWSIRKCQFNKLIACSISEF